MSKEPDEWNEEQKEALDRWASKDRSERHPHDLLPGGRKGEQESSEGSKEGSANNVASEQCKDMRIMFKENSNLTIKAMAEEHYPFHRSTIAEHVFGRRCNHQIDEEPAESPMGNIDSDDFIGAEECITIRKMFHDGMDIVEIKEEENLTYGQCYHHVAGRCRCNHDIPDKNGETLGEKYEE